MHSNRVTATAMAALAFVSVVCGHAARLQPAAAATPAQEAADRPNILLIVTDDQRANTLGVMPEARRRFVKGGRKFTDAFAVTPLCCPSRASILTGRYPHNHGVLVNGQAGKLDQSTTVARYLHNDGYKTGMAGKFLNGWLPPDAPPHFDRYALFSPPGRFSYDYSTVENDGYYNALFNTNGTLDHVSTYSTKYIAEMGSDFVESFEANDDVPWFLYLAPYGPHAPYTPEPRYAATAISAWNKPPSFGERDLSDKPGWVRKSQVSSAKALSARAKQLRNLMSVDDMVEDVFSTLDRLDETRDTLAIFMSDNGYLWGEHRLGKKRYPYAESIKIPMLMRWPGRVKPGSKSGRLAATIDVVPTILEASRTHPADAVPIDGKSLLGETKRKVLYLEFFRELGVPTWSSLWTGRVQLTHYYSRRGKQTSDELYDLARDPWQLQNSLPDGSAVSPSHIADLAERLVEARSCVGSECP